MAEASLLNSPVRSETLSQFEQHRKTPFKSNLKFIFMGAIIVCAAAFIIFSAMQGATVYYYDVHEVQAKLDGNALGADPFRMSGQVLPGSIKKIDSSNSYTFQVSDMKLKDQTMTVTYKGVVPDTFKDEAQVTVTGTFDKSQHAFVATTLLAKCPSKYSSTAN